MEIGILLLSILVIIVQCLGAHKNFSWTPELDRKVVEIYRQTSPLRSGHTQRIKTLWDEELPMYRDLSASKLRQHACVLVKRADGVREKQIRVNLKKISEQISQIHFVIKDTQFDNEKILRELLLEHYPDYKRVEPKIIQRIIRSWYKNLQPEDSTLTKVSQWSGQMKADLLYIHNQNVFGKGQIHDRLKERWEEMHPELKHMSGLYLKKLAYILKNGKYRPGIEELEEAKRKYNRIMESERGRSRDKVKSGEESSVRKTRWSREQNVDLYYLFEKDDIKKKGVGNRLKKQWIELYPHLDFISGRSLQKQAVRLIDKGFEPSQEEKETARIKYEKLKRSKQKVV